MNIRNIHTVSNSEKSGASFGLFHFSPCRFAL